MSRFGVTNFNMKQITSSIALIAAMTAAPAIAQSEDAAEAVIEAADAAIEAVAETAANEVAARPTQARTPPPMVDVPRVEVPKRARDPRLKNYRFINPVDYPIASWNEGEEGRVDYEVAVDAQGNALSCSITESSGFARLDSATCPLVMERAGFRPAQNSEGEDVAGTYKGSQRWRKKEPDLPMMSVIFQYTHDEKGRSSDCKFLKMENLPEEMRKEIERDRERGKLCPGPTGKQGTPYRDENGVPIAKRVTVSFDVVLEEPVAAAEE